MYAAVVRAKLSVSGTGALVMSRTSQFNLSRLRRLHKHINHNHRHTCTCFLCSPSGPVARRSRSHLTAVTRGATLKDNFSITVGSLRLHNANGLLNSRRSKRVRNINFSLCIHVISRTIRRCGRPRQARPITIAVSLPVRTSVPISCVSSSGLQLRTCQGLTTSHASRSLGRLTSRLASHCNGLPRRFRALFNITHLHVGTQRLNVSRVITRNGGIHINGVSPPRSVRVHVGHVCHKTRCQPIARACLVPTPFTNALNNGPVPNSRIVS